MCLYEEQHINTCDFTLFFVFLSFVMSQDILRVCVYVCHVMCYRFIGITITENLFWSSQITAVAKKKHRKVSTSYGNVVRLDSRARFGSAITEEQKKASRLEI